MNCPRSFALAVVLSCGWLSTASARGSECVASAPVDAGALLQASALVFAGTLVEGDQYTLIFAPARIWKGDASGRATVYIVGRPFVGAYAFQPGKRYLVAARVLEKEERWALLIGDQSPTAFGFQRPCGSPLPLSLVPALDTLARPRTPR